MSGELAGATGRLIGLEMLWDEVDNREAYPFSIPALARLRELSFDRPVTFLVGENGSGKSTLLEGLAVAAGLNNVASAYQEIEGGPDYHKSCHGESFLDVVGGRFRGPGLYLMDEPESALSVMGQLQLLVHMEQAVAQGGPFVIVSHSPILTAFPEAVIYRLNEAGISEAGYTETDPYQLTKSFLESPMGFLQHLLPN